MHLCLGVFLDVFCVLLPVFKKNPKNKTQQVLLQSRLFLVPSIGDAVLDDVKPEVKVDMQHFHTSCMFHVRCYIVGKEDRDHLMKLQRKRPACRVQVFKT